MFYNYGVSAGCPSGYTDEVPGRCFQTFTHERVYYDTAKSRCEDDDAVLASIHSQEELDTVPDGK